MNKGKEIIYDGGCPDAQMFSEYISGKLKPAIHEQVAAHVASCPFCNEAAEGLEFASQSESITEITSDLNSRVDKRLEKNNRKLIWFSVAAVLFVALFSGYLFVTLDDIRSSEPVSETIIPDLNKEGEQLSSFEIDKDTSFKNSQSDGGSDATANTLVQNSETELVIHEEEDAMGTAETFETDASDVGSDEKKIETVETRKDDNTVTIAKTAEKSAIPASVSESEISQVMSVQAPAARDKLEERVNNDPDNVASVKEPRMSRGGAEKKKSVTKSRSASDEDSIVPDPIEKAFSEKDHLRVIELTSSASSEENKFRDQWYRANSLIALSRFNEAKVILKELIMKSTAYSDKAGKLLEKTEADGH